MLNVFQMNIYITIRWTKVLSINYLDKKKPIITNLVDHLSQRHGKSYAWGSDFDHFLHFLLLTHFRLGVPRRSDVQFLHFLKISEQNYRNKS